MRRFRILLFTSMVIFFATNLLAQTFNVSTTPKLRMVLSNAAANGEDDTIVLSDGVYKTTDDGQGTFFLRSKEKSCNFFWI